MFKTAVPIHINERTNKDEVLRVLEAVGAEYVFLAFDNVILSADRGKYERTLASACEMIPLLKSRGYKVGIWFWSLWLCDIDADELDGEVMRRSSGKPRISYSALNSTEKKLSGYLCPTSEKISVMLDIIECAARYSPDIILLNDDLGYATYLGGIGCYCDRHIRLVEEALSRPITREELREAVLSGKPNEIRDLWLDISGRTIEDYARRIRERIDSVDKNIRCGFCAVMSNWGIDGTDAEKIAKIMAGGTRPLIRLIGAPYWAAISAWGNRLQHTVELSRMESAWVSDKEIELIAEGDVYPRPRHRVPASLLEIYDTALRASGACDGILKIMFDYMASIGYERGYLDRHIKNQGLYSEIERIFGGKSAVGVRVYESMDKVRTMDFSGIADPDRYAAESFFSYAARLLSDNSIPTAYEGSGVGIAFGENARHLPDEAFEQGLILDIPAARILMERGVDVGLSAVGEPIQNNSLYFPCDGECIPANYRAGVASEIIPKDTARVVTYSVCGERLYPDTIEYEDERGRRFLVFAFDGALVDENRYRNYLAQRQLAASIEWLAGERLPAVCLGNPDLYMICKQDDDGMAIGLWNIFADEIEKPVIRLSHSYRSAEFINCEGILEGDEIRLSELPPYGCAFIHLEA